MSEQVKSAPEWPVRVLRTLIGIEAIGMLAVAVMLIYDLLTLPALSVATSLALIVLAFIGAAFLAAIVVGIRQGQTWTRSAAITWQVLQTAAAVVILQGDMAQLLGWVIAILALAVLILIFHPAVTEQLRRR